MTRSTSGTRSTGIRSRSIHLETELRSKPKRFASAVAPPASAMSWDAFMHLCDPKPHGKSSAFVTYGPPPNVATGHIVTMAKELRGDRLKALREARGEDQMVTAVAVGIDRSHLSKMEKGTKQPSLEKLLRLAAHFEVDPNYLVGWPVSGLPQSEEPAEDANERALFAAFRRLLREERGTVERLVGDATITSVSAGGKKDDGA